MKCTVLPQSRTCHPAECDSSVTTFFHTLRLPVLNQRNSCLCAHGSPGCVEEGLAQWSLGREMSPHSVPCSHSRAAQEILTMPRPPAAPRQCLLPDVHGLLHTPEPPSSQVAADRPGSSPRE